MVRGLEQRLSEEVPREVGLSSLEKRWFWEDLMAPFQYTSEVTKKMEPYSSQHCMAER